MGVLRPELTMGIEEEYLIVDRRSRDLVRDLPPGLMERCEEILGSQVSPEFLRCQIEVGTGVCQTVSDAKADLRRLRRTIADVTAEYGLAPISASTHPFAAWSEQQHTDKERYRLLARAMAGVAQRLVICGMHVHVGIEDPDLRIDLMNQVVYFMPHLLALSTSSPFWGGQDTGLKSYRTSVFRTLPRTGLPDEFSSWADYSRHVAVLVNAGVIEDATKLWWDVRPSARYPTLEMRSTDICTSIDDAIAIAALYRCLLSMLYRMRERNQRWRIYSRMLLEENLWRAQRYGFTESLIDFGKGELVPYPELLDEMISMIAQDAKDLDCVAEIDHLRAIASEGTSADKQLAVHGSAVEAGAGEHEALQAVVDFLIDETVRGV
jgi:glutamate---cysteine ligase / carboxylate-amine ligase